MLSDRYIAEFMEKYEHLNLAGYNAGGYAYRESKKIFQRAEEDPKSQQRGNMKDVSQLAESIKVRSNSVAVQGAGMRRPTSLIDKMKIKLGLQVAQPEEEQVNEN